MAWTPELDYQDRIVPVDAIGGQYDAALDGEPLMLDWDGTGQTETLGHPEAAGYATVGDELGIPQQSTSDDISENKLSENEFWRSMRNWNGGMGQNRFDVPKVSSEAAYYETSKLDVREPAELKIRRAAATASPANFTTNLFASETATNGFWFISRTDGVNSTVQHYDFTTLTTQNLVTGAAYYDLTVDPTNAVYIANNVNIATTTLGAGATTQWCAQSAGVIQAAKGRLFAIGISAVGPPEIRSIFEIPTEGVAPVAATNKLNLPGGYYGADIKEAGALVLFACNPFDFRANVPTSGLTGQTPRSSGALYAYNGTDTPHRALVMPPGECIYAIHSALGGSLVLLFVVRQDGAGTVRTLIYQVNVTGTTISSPQIAYEYPERYTHNICCNETVSLGRQIYFVAPGDGTTASCGIDAYDIAEGTVHHDIRSTGLTAGASYPRSLTTYDGRLVWGEVTTTTGSRTVKLELESATAYEASGTVDTSVIDLNVDAPKLWTTVEVSCLPLTAGQKIDIAWSASQPGTEDFTLLGTIHPGQALASFPLHRQSVRLRLRATLYSGASATTTPTVTKIGVAAQLARLPKRSHLLKVRAYPGQHDYRGAPMDTAGDSYLHRLATRIDGLRTSGRAVWFQPPTSRWDGHAERVRVGEFLVRQILNPEQGAGGLVAVALHNVDVDRRNLWPLSFTDPYALPVTPTLADTHEMVGTATQAGVSAIPWTGGGTTRTVHRVTVPAVADGVRGPYPYTTTPWDPVANRGLPLSAGVVVRPSVSTMILTFSVKAYNAAGALQQTNSRTFTLGASSANNWFLCFVEDFNYDALNATSLLYLVGEVVLAASSGTGTLDPIGWQLEQSKALTRYQQPPATY